MKIKLDENIPREVAIPADHDVDTAFDEGLSAVNDEEVWSATQSAGRFFVTQDLDFADLRRFLPGTHHGLLLVRLKNPSRSQVAAKVRALLTLPEIETWKGAFVVATDSKLRVRRPPD